MGSSDDLEGLVMQFVQERPILDLPGPVADSFEVCEEFVDLAHEHGFYGADLLVMKGYRGPARFSGMSEEELVEVEHAIVEVDSLAFDFTFRQFNPNARVPTIYDRLDDLAIDWAYCREHPDGEWRELPGPEEYRESRLFD